MERIQNAEYFHARQACYLCLQPHDCVDTSIVIEGEGVLALCHGCIRDLALTSGYAVDDDRSAEIAQLNVDLEAAVDRMQKAEKQLAQMNDYGRRLESLDKARKVRSEKAVSA